MVTMIFTRLVHADRFDDASQYRPTDEKEVFEKLEDGDFVAALEYVRETDEDTQYPMEDVLDRFLAHIDAFEVTAAEHPKGQVDVFSSSDLEGIVTMIGELLGRRAYNVDLVEDGQEVVSLTIDDSVADAKV